jgi:hypothetical protein
VPAYLVEYGMADPDRNHPRMSKAIKKKYSYWRILEYTWIVEASGPATRIYDHLEANIGPDDKLFVCLLDVDAALTDNFSDEGTAWLERIV